MGKGGRRHWWSRSGSNRRPVACKATALPTELRPPDFLGVPGIGRRTKKRSSKPILRDPTGQPTSSTATRALDVDLDFAEAKSCFLHRKEVIQPQVPLRLPCYDFIPITSPTLGRCLPRVGSRTSGRTGFHDVTGGVYKARERIHGVVADTPLLAIPTSWSRVADSNPNWAWF